MGYGKPVVKLTFPELQSSPDDLVWMVIRNPQLIPPEELSSFYDDDSVELDENDRPKDMKAATSATNRMLAHLVVAWRVYDATWLPAFDDQGDPVDDPENQAPLLPLPATAESCARLPMAIKDRFSEELTKANPQRTPA